MPLCYLLKVSTVRKSVLAKNSDYYLNRTNQLHGCVKDVVEAQCGQEITSALSGLAHLVQSAAGCPTSRLRALPYSQKHRRGT